MATQKASTFFFLLWSSLGSHHTADAWLTGAPLENPFTRVQSSTSLLKATENDDSDTPKTIQEAVIARLPSLAMLGDLSGGRPGAIIETAEQLQRKAEIIEEIEAKTRDYPDWAKDYGRLIEEEEAEYDTDDPNAMDSSTLGQYTFKDLEAKFDYEWDPDSGEPDPNFAELNKPGLKFIEKNEVDEEGLEVGYDPMFGPSNPMDTRTMWGTRESYVVSEETRDESKLTPQFLEGDLEVEYNQEIVDFRKSLDVIEAYTDEFLNMTIPRHVAKWHGYPEPMWYPPKDPKENTFTKPEDETDFSNLSPYRARRKAVELARAKNADWLPPGVSHAWHKSQRQPYEDQNTLVGSLRPGEIDSEILDLIQPALNILGSSAKLLSIEQGTVFRFEYYGLMKNRHGMSCWAETLIRDCGVEVTGVVFETGFRRRDPAYDGGDHWYAPTF